MQLRIVQLRTGARARSPCRRGGKLGEVIAKLGVCVRIELCPFKAFQNSRAVAGSVLGIAASCSCAA